MRTLLLLWLYLPALLAAAPVEVVATLPNYAALAREVGGDRVHVQSIVLPDQDPHFVRPKPSFALMIQRADLFMTTCLDLELWGPALLDKAANARVLDGRPGFCAMAPGVPLLDVPTAITRAVGDIHIYGNPHFYASPLHLRLALPNLTAALIRVDPVGESYYRKNAETLTGRLEEALYGAALLKAVPAAELDQWVLADDLDDRLKKRGLEGQLGGWLKKGAALRGLEVVNYHSKWAYLCQVFGMRVAAQVEPKPGIPPSPRDIMRLADSIKTSHVKLIFDASYYREDHMKRIADAAGIPYVIVPAFAGDQGTTDLFGYFDTLLERLVHAAGGTH